MTFGEQGKVESMKTIQPRDECQPKNFVVIGVCTEDKLTTTQPTGTMRITVSQNTENCLVQGNEPTKVS